MDRFGGMSLGRKLSSIGRVDLHLHGLKSNGLFNFNVTIPNRATYEEFQ